MVPLWTLCITAGLCGILQAQTGHYVPNFVTLA